MTSQDICKRIILALGVALDAHAKERRLTPLLYVHNAAQQAIYWLRLAPVEEIPEVASAIEETPSQESINSLQFIPPTLFGVKEHLDYLNTELKSIAKDADNLAKGYVNYVPTQESMYNAQRAYDKIHESIYNSDLAIELYERITERR